MRLKLSRQSLPERAEFPGRRGQPAALEKWSSDRYRDRARLAIAAVDRVRAKIKMWPPDNAGSKAPRWTNRARVEPRSPAVLSAGGLVLYCPPGDQRVRRCRVTKVQGDRAYLVPELPDPPGWVDLESLALQSSVDALRLMAGTHD